MAAVVLIDAGLYGVQRLYSRDLCFNNIRVIQHGIYGEYIEFRFVFGGKLESDYPGFAGK
jgi:hypothetical protein